MKKLWKWLGTAGLAALLTACGAGASQSSSASSQAQAGQINVVTSFYPVYEFTKQVLGDQGQVSMMVGAGVEAHGYEPSAKDVAKVNEADAFIYLSDYMETWAPSLVESLDSSKTQVIEATQNMILLPAGEEEEDHDHEEEGHSHEFDPHVWVSPYRAKVLVQEIADQLSTAFPDKSDQFEANAKAYLEKLTALDQKYQDSLSVAKQKYFVTQHSAFSYLALDYGLKQVGITGIAADVEPSPARLAELTQYVKDNQIKVIYFEENANQKLAATLAQEAGVELAVLNPIESLTQDQMDQGKDYISLMEDNLVSLEKTTKQEGIEIAPEHEEETKETVYNGYFQDADVKDRPLTDYAGTWQSVYPYLLDGSLDQVFDIKAKLSGTMTAEEYKDYYQVGYKTDIQTIEFQGNKGIFTNDQGKSMEAEYEYVGYKILQYKKGNRGVRYLFEAKDASSGAPKYIQFSDHAIAPGQANHFHIYMGNESQEKLLEEMENWPTYYPSDLDAHQIAQEMIAH